MAKKQVWEIYLWKQNGYKYIFIVLLYLLGLWPENPKWNKKIEKKIEARVLESRWSKEIR